jgi:hypothetical protein
MSSTNSALIGGRPGPRCLLHCRHLCLAAWRCHRNRVCGVTMKERHRARGSNRLSAARIARSAGRCLTRPWSCRWRTRTWCRSTTISTSRSDSVHRQRHNETEHATQAEVEEREEHTGSCLRPPRTSWSRVRSYYWCPSAPEFGAPAICRQSAITIAPRCRRPPCPEPGLWIRVLGPFLRHIVQHHRRMERLRQGSSSPSPDPGLPRRIVLAGSL